MKRKLLITLIGLALLAPASPALARDPAGNGNQTARVAQIPGMIPLTRLRLIKPNKAKRRPTRRKVGWGSGEHMTYRVSLAGVWGGRAAMSVGKVRGKGRRATLSIRGLGETVPFISAIRHMREDLTTSVRLRDLAPLNQVADRKAPNKDRLLKTRFSAPLKQTITHQGKTHHRTRGISGGGPLLDPITALFSLRTVKLKPGAALRMRVVNGTSMMLVEAKVMGFERIFVDGKAHDTVKVEGTGRKIRDDGVLWPNKAPRHLAIWFTRDSTRIPVRVEGDTRFGKIVALLTSYKAPRRGLRVGVASISAAD